MGNVFLSPNANVINRMQIKQLGFLGTFNFKEFTR